MSQQNTGRPYQGPRQGRRRTRSWLMLALATLGFAVNFWALGAAEPARAEAQGRAAAEPRSSRPCWWRCRWWSGRWAYPGRCADRPVRRPGDVPAGFARHDRPGSVSRAGRACLIGRFAGRRVLPRYRRHDLRHRGPLRHRLVPAGQTRSRRRRLRHGHGRHRDQCADHGQTRRGARHGDAVRGHRGGADRLRRLAALLLRDAPGRVGADRAVVPPAGRDAAAADHLARLRFVRGGLRRLRGVLGVPAGLPEDRLRADARRTRPTGWPDSCCSP